MNMHLKSDYACFCSVQKFFPSYFVHSKCLHQNEFVHVYVDVSVLLFVSGYDNSKSNEGMFCRAWPKEEVVQTFKRPRSYLDTKILNFIRFHFQGIFNGFGFLVDII